MPVVGHALAVDRCRTCSERHAVSISDLSSGIGAVTLDDGSSQVQYTCERPATGIALVVDDGA